jgi:class 3 adenylate cyclase
MNQPAGHRSDAQRTQPAVDSLTLRFRDPALEARYRTARETGDLRQTRICFLVGAALNIVVGALDYFALTENVAIGLALRTAVVTFVLCALTALTYHPLFAARRVTLSIIGLCLFTAFYATLNAVSGTPDIYLPGYILVILFLLVFVPVGFTVACVTSFSCTVAFATVIPLTREIEPLDLLTIYYQFAAANLIGMIALYWIERFRRVEFINLESIASERSRYRDLLVRILPQTIAERLERGEHDIADDFSETTVLFADIVGFTDFSARHRPAEIVDLLNRVFGEFDQLVERHGVEKIKTIGDAYLVAGGLPEEKPDHCEAIAALALDMMAAAHSVQTPDGEPIEVRIGIHTGPVIAGVIGDKRFLYDLWGDTVNIASRMESTGTPGRIQVSDEVRRRLATTHDFTQRGEVEVKGKGRMTTWYLDAGAVVAETVPGEPR